MDGGIAAVSPGANGSPDGKEKRKKLIRLGVLVAALSLGGAVYAGYVPVPAQLTALIGGKIAPSGPIAGGAPAAAASSSTSPAAAPPAVSPPAASTPLGPSVRGNLVAASGDGVGISLKLKDVTAPQPGDTCANASGKDEDVGIQARTALGMLIGDSSIDCELSASGAVCRLPDGSELNRRVIELGWATARTGSAYEPAENAAKASRRGIWGICPSLK